MNILSVIHIITFTTYCWLIVFVLSKDARAVLNRAAALLLAALAWWSLADAFLHSAPSAELAAAWENASALGWASFASFQFIFVLIFAKRKHVLKKRYIVPVLIAIPIGLVYLQIKGLMIVDFMPQPYGWAYNWATGPWPLIYQTYYLLLIVIGLYLCYSMAQDSRFINEQKQAEIIFNTTLIAMTLGSIVNVVLPNLGIYAVPPIAPTLTLIWAGGIVYAITRYRLMSITPAAAADEILYTMPDPFIMSDHTGIILAVNRATEKLLGYGRDELAGKTLETVIECGDNMTCEALLKSKKFERLFSDGALSNLEVNYRTRDGRLIPVLFAATLMRNRHGMPLAIISISRDMREMKNLHDELLRQKRLADIGKLASGVGHEFRNPLASIKNIAYFVRKRLKIEDPQLIHFFTMLSKEIDTMDRIATALINYSRVKRLHCQPIRPATMIAEALTAVQRPENITVSNSISPEMAAICVDAERMQHVFMNVFSNAVQSMQKGGTIHIEAAREDDWIHFHINDTGCGMSEEMIAHIFDPLFTTKPQQIGLGMAIAHDIVNRHSGRIAVQSTKGTGTTVTVSLPAHLPADTGAPEDDEE